MISFVLTARNESPVLLEKTINGLLATSSSFAREIIVVDDASTEPVVAGRDVRVVRNNRPHGASGARRRGGLLVKGDVLCFLDPHMSFAPGWLEAMVEHVDSGALLCAAWSDYRSLAPLCYGADYTWIRKRDYSKALTPGLSFVHRTDAPSAPVAEVPMVIGACYMMLRSAYEAVGGYSPLMGVWGRSEEDISARAWLLGAGVRCVADARVGHLSVPRFAYRASWAHIEFNQTVILRTIFSPLTAREAMRTLGPLPPLVRSWVEKIDVEPWRRFIQGRRHMSDHAFLSRFVPDAPRTVIEAAGRSCSQDDGDSRRASHAAAPLAAEASGP